MKSVIFQLNLFISMPVHEQLYSKKAVIKLPFPQPISSTFLTLILTPQFF